MQQVNHYRQRRSWVFTIISVGLPGLAFVLSLLAVWLWFTETNEKGSNELPISGDTHTLDQAQFVLERANDAVNSAELILSFLEGASVVIAISIAAAAVVGLSSLNELRDTVSDTERELFKRVEEAEARLIARERQLANMEDLLAEAQVRIDLLVEERLRQVYAETESARRQAAALARHALAEQLMREKNIDAALKACEDAARLDPDNYANNYLYGMLLIEKGQFETAIARLEEALKAEPDFVPAIAALGLANRRAGDNFDDRHKRNERYNIAESRLLEAMDKDPALLTPDGESYYGTLGSLYRRQERIDDALDSYRRASEATPRRSYPFVNLAMLYMQKGHEQLRDQNLLIAERNALRRVDDTPTDYWALYDLALIQLIRGNEDLCLQYLKEAFEVTPNSVSVYYSVVARLLFLESINSEMAGLRHVTEMVDTQIQRASTR